MAGSEAGNTLHHSLHSLGGGRARAVLRNLTEEIGGWKGLTSQAGGVLVHRQGTEPGSRWSGVNPGFFNPDLAICWPCPWTN